MSYTPHEWQNNEFITAEKLNHIEEGIAEGGGGGWGLVANMDTNTAILDKTWQEIYDAPFCIVRIVENGTAFSFAVNKISQYTLSAYAYDGENLQYLVFATNAADGYPMLQEPD